MTDTDAARHDDAEVERLERIARRTWRFADDPDEAWRDVVRAVLAALPPPPSDAAVARVAEQARDLCWKATPAGEDATGAVTRYMLPAGVVHRLVGALQGAGVHAALRNPGVSAADDSDAAVARVLALRAPWPLGDTDSRWLDGYLAALGDVRAAVATPETRKDS